MSFYLGKDSLNESILAITNNTVSESLIKSQVTNFSNFSFHSKAGYMFNDILEYTVTWKDSYKEVYIPISLSFMVNNGISRTIFVFIDNIYVTVNTEGSPVVPGFDKAYYYNKTNGRLYLYDSTKATGSSSNILVIATNYYSLELRNETIDYSGSVLFNSDVFLINGQDYFTKKWMCTPPINTIDKVVNILGISYQILNYVPAVGNISIDSTNGIKIAKGGKCLVDTTVAGFTPLMPNSFDGIQTQTKNIYLYRPGGNNAPLGFGNTSFPLSTVTFDTNIAADNSLILLEVVRAGSAYTSKAILMNTSNSSWINYGVDFMPADGGIGICNSRLGIRITNGKIQISIDGGNCMSGPTNDATPYVINSNYYIRYVYVSR